MKLNLFVGDNLYARDSNGKTVEFRAVVIGDTLYVRADHSQFTSEQLVRHEAGHQTIAQGGIDLAQIKEQLRASLGEENAQEVADLYSAYFAGSDLTEAEIFEEFVCDALGDMNVFGMELLDNETLNAALEQAKGLAQGMAQQFEARGPPASTEKFSRKAASGRTKEIETMENNRFERLRQFHGDLPRMWYAYTWDNMYLYLNSTATDYTTIKKIKIGSANRSNAESLIKEIESGVHEDAAILDMWDDVFGRRKGRNSRARSGVGEARAARSNDRVDEKPKRDGADVGKRGDRNGNSEVLGDNGRPSGGVTSQKFSMESSVEEKGSLVALHNLNVKKLSGSLDLGGFPMPSIAVTRHDIPHTNFGDITLVMDKSTVDPRADRRNTVYSADAWTPTFPQIEYEANEKVASAIRSRYYALSRKIGYEAAQPMAAYVNELEDQLNRYGGEAAIIEKLKTDTDMMNLYLQDTGKPRVEDVQKETVVRLDDETIAQYDYLIDALGKDVVNALHTQGDETPIAVRRRWVAEHGDDLVKAYRSYLIDEGGMTQRQADEAMEGSSFTAAALSREVIGARRYLNNGPERTQTQYDGDATRNAILGAVDQKDYEAWLHGLFDGVEKSKGIYNNKDIFTPSGNRRSFSATHYEVTLDNIVKAMAGQNDGKTKAVSGFSGEGTLRAASAKRFKSIADMHALEGRLQHMTEEQTAQMKDNLNSRVRSVLNRAAEKTKYRDSNPFIAVDNAGNVLTEVAGGGKYTIDSIEKAFAKYGYNIGNELAADMRDLLFDASQMPVNIFEAKPERVVGFDEVRAAVLPSDTDAKLISRLQNAGVEDVLTYEKGNDGDRLAKVNSVQGVRFSRESEQFSRDIDTWNYEGRDSDSTFILGSTGQTLQGLGAIESDIYLHSAKVNDILDNHPEMSIATIKQLPSLIDDPIFVAESLSGGKASRNSRLILYGNVKGKNGKPVLAVLDLQPIENGLVVNRFQKVVSAYSKTDDALTDKKPRIRTAEEKGVEYLRECNVLYAEKSRAPALLQHIGFNMPIRLLREGSTGYISYADDFVKFTGTPFSEVVEESGASGLEEGATTYSRESDTIKTLQDENAELREKVETLRGEFKVTKDKTVRADDLDKLTRSLLRDYSSKADADAVRSGVKELSEYIVRNGDESGDLVWTGVKDRATRIAADIVENAEELRSTDDDALRGIRDYFREVAIDFKEKDQRDIPDFGEWRKSQFGKLKFSPKGMGIDAAYQELQEMYPGYFPADITAPSDQLLYVAELVDKTKKHLENPYSFDMAAAVELCANEIIDSTIGLREKHTFADKAKQRVEKQKIADRKQIKKVMEREKQRRDKKIAALKESFRDKEARTSEALKARTRREQIKRHATDMAGKLLKPTDKRHIPEPLKGSVKAVLESINLESKNGRDTKRTAAFAALKKALAEVGSDYVIDPDLVGADGELGYLDEVIAMADTPIAEMGTAQLEKVWQTLRAVEATISTADKMFASGKFQRVSDLASAIREDNKHKKQRVEYRGALGKAQKIATLESIQPNTYFHRLGKPGDAMFRMMRGAQDKFITILKRSSDYTEKSVKLDARKMEAELHTVTLGGNEVQLSTAQLMELYVLMNREQAANHILVGGILPNAIKGKGLRSISRAEPIRGISSEELMAALHLLTPEQISAAQKMQEYLSKDMSEYGNEASMAVYNYKKFGEDTYWPIRTNKQELQSSIEKDTQTTSIANKGFTKALTPNANTSVMLGSIFDTFSKHVCDMATYSSYLGVMEDVNRVRNFTFRNENGARVDEVKAILDRVNGTGGAHYLQQLLTDIANGVAGTEKYSKGLIGNYKASAIGANLRVILQQPTSIYRALDMIDAKYFANLKTPRGGWEKAAQYVVPITGSVN